MTTIRQLIQSLNQNENLDEPILYEYYTKSHFEHTGVTDEVWAKIASEYDEILINEDSFATINALLKEAK